MNKKRKLVLSLFVIVFTLLATVTATYAYWASTISVDDDTATGTVTIGEGDIVTSEVTVTSQTNGGLLVPVGHAGGLDVDNVNLTFPVIWTTDNDTGADAFTGTLSVVVESIEINGVDYSGLFKVTIVSGTGSITEDVSQSVVINVEFTNEPENATEYGLVANENIVVTLTFKVVPNAA